MPYFSQFNVVSVLFVDNFTTRDILLDFVLKAIYTHFMENVQLFYCFLRIFPKVQFEEARSCLKRRWILFTKVPFVVDCRRDGPSYIFELFASGR